VETVHEVLKPGGQATVRCTECGHVHKRKLPEPELVERDVIISQDGESFSTIVEVPASESVTVGEEFIAETDEAIFVVRVTSLEQEGDRRVESAAAADVETFWTRAIDNVSVNVTVHPKDGRRDESRSLKIDIPGDYEFVIGTTEEFGDEEFTVEGIYVRDDAEGYRFDKLNFDGDSVAAKDVKRIYALDETSTAWSAW